MVQLKDEVVIELAGQERTMKSTFTAIRGIERDLGRGLMSIVWELGSTPTDSVPNISVTQVAMIIHNGLKGYGDTRMSLNEVGEAVLKGGFTNYLVPIIDFLSGGLGDGDNADVGKQVETPNV